MQLFISSEIGNETMWAVSCVWHELKQDVYFTYDASNSTQDSAHIGTYPVLEMEI
jgi:hypothetical protein